jgi:hypothetical protein
MLNCLLEDETESMGTTHKLFKAAEGSELGEVT